MGVNEKLLKGKLVDKPNEEKLPIEEILRLIAISIEQEAAEAKKNGS
ncbi:MAG: hypothetical protein KA715_03130 [Xanthomonadaceae bacterium]|nr:hypothetical protein [Xanthomonadaceae bacterium]